MHYSLWHEINHYLIFEARLLDERRFEEWLDLFTHDATYFMPGRSNAWQSGTVADSIGKPGELAVFEDTRATLATRVKRLRTGKAWGENPPSRTRHLITNVDIEPADGDPDALRVRSNFIVYRAQLEHDKDIFVGSRDDRISKVGGEWKIASRTILMEDVVHNSKPLSIFF